MQLYWQCYNVMNDGYGGELVGGNYTTGLHCCHVSGSSVYHQDVMNNRCGGEHVGGNYMTGLHC